MGNVSPLRYDTSADVIRRLHNTFIIYKGVPVYVAQVADLTIGVMHLHAGFVSQDLTWIHSSDEDIDLESPHLGWANVSIRNAIRPAYFLRTVNRQYSQGVDPRKTNWIDVTKDSEALLSGYSWKGWPDLVPLAQMMLNTGYPSIKGAAESVSGRAFDVDWALVPSKSDNIKTLFSDFSPVGYFDCNRQRFVFKKGSLTKTRHVSLEKIINQLSNRNQIYVIDEANT